MKNKKLIFAVLFAGVLALNTLVLSTTNKNDLQLNSLFTLASAQAEDGEDGENGQGGQCTSECELLSSYRGVKTYETLSDEPGEYREYFYNCVGTKGLPCPLYGAKTLFVFDRMSIWPTTECNNTCSNKSCGLTD